MLLYENKKVKLLNFLRIGVNPFKRFVSTGEITEELSVVNSRKSTLAEIVNTIKNNPNIVLPIIADVGIGKTHFYWSLKTALYYYNTIYISLDKVYRKFFYNIYSEFIENIGVEPLRNIINQLCNQWGALERKFGFFHVADVKKVKNVAFSQLRDQFEEDHYPALIDVINGVTIHQLDPYKKVEAEGWLLGELMDVRELSRLNMNSDLRKSKTAFTMLKILIENSKLGTVLFIDDFEKLISMIKPQEDAEEVFDPSWLYGPETSPEEIASKKIIKRISKLKKINGLRIIITLKSIKALDEIKQWFRELQTPNFKFNEPIILKKFEEEDIFEFYKNSMKNFTEKLELQSSININKLDFFPLNESILRKIYHKYDGNPRKIIKAFIRIFNKIIYSQENLQSIVNTVEI
jgi:hypothetical protein